MSTKVTLGAHSPTGAYFEVIGLQAYYGDSYIVQDVSFSVSEGEIVALLGRNGAGKTSTLRAIARAANPELRAGSIYLHGDSVHDMQDFEAALAGVQLVPEDRRIIPGLTVEENLDIARIEGDSGWAYERIYALFPRLKERRKQEGTTLSGGEQQMLAIARALARDIKLLYNEELRHEYLAIWARANGFQRVATRPKRATSPARKLTLVLHKVADRMADKLALL